MRPREIHSFWVEKVIKLKALTFILTRECDWDCSYCYQVRNARRMDRSLLSSACEKFLPLLADTNVISFTGGEPLLAPDLLRQAVAVFRGRNASGGKNHRFLLTTNGSRLGPDLLAFLEDNRFEIMLSYDGPDQDEMRKPGSSAAMERLLDRLLVGRLARVGTNSVFTPENARHVFDTLRGLAERGVPEVYFSLNVLAKWGPQVRRKVEAELDRLRSWQLDHYQRYGTVPVISFRRPETRGLFFCLGGRDRLAVDPDGSLWGCHLFADYFGSRKSHAQEADFRFGRLRDFRNPGAGRFRRIRQNYGRLGMDRFQAEDSSCLVCDDVEECAVCPAVAAFSSGAIGRISGDLCWFSRELIRQRRRFWREAENRASC